MKKLVCFLSVVLMLTVMIAGGALSVSAEKSQGTCGTGVFWSYDSETKILEISGNGAMKDGIAPWDANSMEIEIINIGKGVTAIGSSAFSGCVKLTSVVFADESELKTIGAEAFYKCGKLESITLPQSVTEIGTLAFYDCGSLKSIDVMNNVDSIGASAFCNTKLGTIRYCGTQAEWDAIDKGDNWNKGLSSIKYITHGSVWEKADDNKHKSECAFCDYSVTEDHKWNDKGVTTTATCSTVGVKMQICSICSATRNVDVAIDPNNHVWDQGIVSKKATHTEEGVKTYTCTNSSHTATRTEVIPVIPHTYDQEIRDYNNNVWHECVCECGAVSYETHRWGEGEKVKEATHTVPGQINYKCVDCGYLNTVTLNMLPTHNMSGWVQHDGVYHKQQCICGTCGEADCECRDSDDTCTYVEYEAHKWDAGKVVEEATHTANGIKEYTCVCGETKTEVIPKLLEHTKGEEWTPCIGDENPEWHKKVCTECNVALEYALHTWDAGKVIKEQNHDRNGIMKYTCTDCGATKEEIILAGHTVDKWDGESTEDQHSAKCRCGAVLFGDHVWGDPVITEPTCAKEGEMKYTCVDCGKTKTEKLPMTTEHTYNDKSKKDANAHTCAVCGKATEEHKWSSGVVVSEPTHTEEGKKEFECTICGQKKSETIPTIEAHSYGEWTDYDENQHAATCSCEDVIYEDHNWDENGVCAVCGNEKKSEEAPESTGCGAVLSVGAGMLLLLSLGSVALISKKKKRKVL